MKHMKTVEIPAQEARTETKVSHITCDLCGKKGDPTWDDTTNWSGSCYNVLETSVILDEGSRYEDRYGTRKVLDICPGCFEKKLIPWFISQGGEVREEEYGL